jgi:hypothetical protein
MHERRGIELSYLEGVAFMLSVPGWRGAALLSGLLLFGCVVVTPLASIVVDPSLGGP